MTTRKRSGSGSKRQFKEKVVLIYESFFRGEEKPPVNVQSFWDEFFLLKPKAVSLEAEILRLTNEQLLGMKENINLLFAQCVETLGQEHHIRVVYALQTLCALTHAVYKKTSMESGFDVINILMGFSVAEERMTTLLDHINLFLTGNLPDSLKALCLKLLLVLVTGTDNVSQNTLLEYVMIHSTFEALIQLLSHSTSRQAHGHDVVLLLTLLVNYRKHEAANPYIVKLSIVDDELALNGYGQVITASLSEFCRQHSSQNSENNSSQQGQSWLTSFTSMVGSMFVSDETQGTRGQQIRANNALLLALYEAVHLNRNFITTLTHSQTEASSAPPSPSNTLHNTAHTDSSDGAQENTNSEQYKNQNNTNLTSINANMFSPSNPDLTSLPSNLLVTFFQYCSIVMQDTKSETSCNNVKLCFIVLSCIAEDQYANTIMHDGNILYKVRLHRMPMRHRKINNTERMGQSQPLAATLIDLLVEFIRSHMMKKLPMELYLLSIGIIHRVLCYQKRSRIRLDYDWKQLWCALIHLVKYLVDAENHLAKKMNVFDLLLRVVNVFNLFITYGDTFLPTPSSYDELYYELNRVANVFDNLYLMARRYSALDCEYKQDAMRLTNGLINIRAITNHFAPKIQAWLESKGLSTPTEEQVLEVVRGNYDSLTLKLQDSLDQYERYTEKPTHTSFFTTLVRGIVNDTRSNLDFGGMDLQAILQEFSSIS